MPVPIRPITVAALYRFARFADPAALRGPLAGLCKAQGVKGTLLLAREGINGTIAGSADGIAAVLAQIRALPDCAALDVKLATAAEQPFHRMKVRLKREIVTMGQPQIDPLQGTGHLVLVFALGIVTGILPALQAMRLRIADALRRQA